MPLIESPRPTLQPTTGRVWTRLLTAVVFVTLLFAGTVAVSRPSAAEGTADPEPRLNLSSIECVDTDLAEVHFVVVNLPDGVTPGELTFTGYIGGVFGTYTIATYDKETGNVFHYSYFGGSGYYEIQSGSVMLSDGSTLELANPYEYSGNYDCGMGGCHSLANQDSWSFTFHHPLVAPASIVVMAQIDRVWMVVGTGTALMSDEPVTIVTGSYILPLPEEATRMRFTVEYLGKVYRYSTIKPASG